MFIGCLSLMRKMTHSCARRGKLLPPPPVARTCHRQQLLLLWCACPGCGGSCAVQAVLAGCCCGNCHAVPAGCLS